jgi:polyisoprenoid-binding protein YceI
MKNILIILSLAIVFIQCKKDDDSPTNLINPTASMTAKVNGASWSAVTRATTLQSGNFVISGTGSLNGNNVMAITVFGATAGTYNLDPLTSQVQFTANYSTVVGNTDSIYQAYQGVVTISNVDAANKKVSGTFSFKARLQDMVTEVDVTEGSFSNLSYTE